MFQIPVNDYVAILRNASTEDHPFKNFEPEVAEKLAPAFIALAHAVADFVDAGRETVGYAETRGVLEDMVHTFPAEEDYVDPFAELLRLMTKSVDGPLVTEGDGTK